MARIVAKAWLTLDGVFDGTKMEEWFTPFHTDTRAKEIVRTVSESDAFLYGRNTYEMLAPYWSSLENNEMGIAAKLNSAPKHVVTTTLRDLNWQNSRIISHDVAESVGELKTRYPNQIVIDGSATLVRSLMKTGLIDEYRLLLHPIVLGSGKRYFREGTKEGLELLEVEQLDAGVLLLRYVPEAAPNTS